MLWKQKANFTFSKNGPTFFCHVSFSNLTILFCNHTSDIDLYFVLDMSEKEVLVGVVPEALALTVPGENFVVGALCEVLAPQLQLVAD